MSKGVVRRRHTSNSRCLKASPGGMSTSQPIIHTIARRGYDIFLRNKGRFRNRPERAPLPLAVETCKEVAVRSREGKNKKSTTSNQRKSHDFPLHRNHPDREVEGQGWRFLQRCQLRPHFLKSNTDIENKK